MPAYEPEITSPKNPRVRAAAALRDRRARDEAGLTLVDGLRELERALAGGARAGRGRSRTRRASTPDGRGAV